MNFPTQLDEIRTLSGNEKEIRLDLERNSIPVGIRVSGSTRGSMQDAFIFADAKPGLARPGRLQRLYRNTAAQNNIHAPYESNSAVARVIYIPSEHATISRDKLATIGTGDTHMLIITIDGGDVEADLITKNHHSSEKFFSGKNIDKRVINNSGFQTEQDRNILPEEQIIDTAPYKKSDQTRVIAVAMTDGAFKGIDNYAISEEDKAEIKKQATSTTRMWLNSDDQSLSELADLFVQNARNHEQTDCITIVAADVTQPATERGVVIGCVDGAKAEGGGRFAQSTAITMSRLAKNPDSGQRLEVTP